MMIVENDSSGLDAAKAVTRSALTAILLLAVTPMAWASDSSPVPPPALPIVKVLLQSSVTGDGQPLVYPTGTPRITSRLVEIPPGAETGRHRHPVPLFAYILEGELIVKADDQPPRHFKAGDAFMETAAWHTGRNESDKPVRLLSVYAGAEGVPLSIKP